MDRATHLLQNFHACLTQTVPLILTDIPLHLSLPCQVTQETDQRQQERNEYTVLDQPMQTQLLIYCDHSIGLNSTAQTFPVQSANGQH